MQKHSPGFEANKINVKLEKLKVLTVCKIALCFVMSNDTGKGFGFFEEACLQPRLLKII